MQAENSPMVVRLSQDDKDKIEKLIGSGFAINRTDYIRRAIREQIVRDAQTLIN